MPRTATVASTPHHGRAGRVLAVVSLLAIGVATLPPAPQAPVTAPFCLVCGDRGGVDAFLNLLLYLPLGAGLALTGTSRTRALVGMSLLSACIELLQLTVIPGRDASLGDFTFNSIGGAIGYVVAVHRARFIAPDRTFASRLSLVAIGGWLAVQLVTSFALAPSFLDVPWYVQVGHSLPGFDRFPGTLLSARIASLPLHDGRIPDGPGARARLELGLPLQIVIRPRGATRRTAPILRLVDSSRREILLLAQRHTSLLLTTRDGADRLRVRPPMFELTDAIPRWPRDTAAIVITARRVPDALEIEVASRDTTSRARRALSPAIGWTLVLPSQWRLTNGSVERALSLVWVAVLLLPLGYWVTLADRAFVALLIVTVPVGLALLPALFRLPVASPAEWLAGVAGIGVGWATEALVAHRGARVPTVANPVGLRPQSAATSRQKSVPA